ncbi:DUF21 domain-containing protein [Nymphaea thermarum]|nr:DUF21 domain-containing protein [Nymphaea thermarum]
MVVEHKCCLMEFFLYIFSVILLVLFAGLMLGLTFGLMSLSLVVVGLEVFSKSDTLQDHKHAGNGDIASLTS